MQIPGKLVFRFTNATPQFPLELANPESDNGDELRASWINQLCKTYGVRRPFKDNFYSVSVCYAGALYSVPAFVSSKFSGVRLDDATSLVRCILGLTAGVTFFRCS